MKKMQPILVGPSGLPLSVSQAIVDPQGRAIPEKKPEPQTTRPVMLFRSPKHKERFLKLPLRKRMRAILKFGNSPMAAVLEEAYKPQASAAWIDQLIVKVQTMATVGPQMRAVLVRALERRKGEIGAPPKLEIVK